MQRLCDIITAQQLTDHIHAITVDAGDIGLAARPGQFVHVKCGDGAFLRRPISICDCRDGYLKIVFEERGPGTRWLGEKKSGELDILGPLGRGFDLTGRNVLLVGGGIGVPPLLYAAREVIGIATAILGFRSADHMILQSHFREICRRVTIATDDGSYGTQGFVTEPLEHHLKQGGYDSILACGPGSMLQAVADLAAAYGIPCQVSLEERMACGVGACLGCAIETNDGQMCRVCADGPVFSATEVF